MRRLGLVFAVGVLMAGTSAYAQIGSTTVDSIAGSGWTGQDTSFFTPPVTNPPTTAGTANFGEGTFNNTPNSVSYNSFVNVTPSLVTFESGNTSSGPFVTTSSFSTVNINFTNTTGNVITPTVASTISAAGLGFYIADKSGGCDFASCPGTLAHSFADFAASTGSQSTPLAGASFNFDIIGDDRTIYSLTGSVNLFVNSDGAFITQTLDSIGAGSASNSTVDPNDASHQLAGFTQAWDTQSAFGYAWDATDILPTFLDSLNPGQTGFMTYETSVSSFSHSFCLTDNTCLVAYSGFGDPVGRGGDITSALTFGGFGNLRSFGLLQPPVIQGVNFSPSSFNLPTFGPDGVLTFQPAGVPEPATWMTMILGFGLLGGTLRRRRTVAAI